MIDIAQGLCIVLGSELVIFIKNPDGKGVTTSLSRWVKLGCIKHRTEGIVNQALVGFLAEKRPRESPD